MLARNPLLQDLGVGHLQRVWGRGLLSLPYVSKELAFFPKVSPIFLPVFFSSLPFSSLAFLLPSSEEARQCLAFHWQMNVIIVLSVTRWSSWAQYGCNPYSSLERGLILEENWQLVLSNRIISCAFKKTVENLHKFFPHVLPMFCFVFVAKTLWKHSVVSVLSLMFFLFIYLFY